MDNQTVHQYMSHVQNMSQHISGSLVGICNQTDNICGWASYEVASLLFTLAFSASMMDPMASAHRSRPPSSLITTEREGGGAVKGDQGHLGIISTISSIHSIKSSSCREELRREAAEGAGVMQMSLLIKKAETYEFASPKCVPHHNRNPSFAPFHVALFGPAQASCPGVHWERNGCN